MAEVHLTVSGFVTPGSLVESLCEQLRSSFGAKVMVSIEGSETPQGTRGRAEASEAGFAWVTPLHEEDHAVGTLWLTVTLEGQRDLSEFDAVLRRIVAANGASLTELAHSNSRSRK